MQIPFTLIQQLFDPVFWQPLCYMPFHPMAHCCHIVTRSDINNYAYKTNIIQQEHRSYFELTINSSYPLFKWSNLQSIFIINSLLPNKIILHHKWWPNIKNHVNGRNAQNHDYRSDCFQLLIIMLQTMPTHLSNKSSLSQINGLCVSN